MMIEMSNGLLSPMWNQCCREKKRFCFCQIFILHSLVTNPSIDSCQKSNLCRNVRATIVLVCA